ncbi:alpha-amylase family glycosyl hydrolase [Facklamia miroungae]|uniref:Glycosidase n=1 Tax=Facklamia miroungae TaxID=120956 RepID=A0A1G7T9F5_9LACT|nr:alpha-amylase family glycosyl hydrolase [Facklamia miroungae]NKZ29722.1 alpha-amylase [Facklamia miroungae]SDG31851.1 Glycosidase [Facklamia miroungae]
MAIDSSVELRNLVLYSIFIRNFSQEGTFRAVEAEIPRLKKMGIDMIWFLPHYPIGMVKRKGQAGSPYAIQDYRQVHQDLGSREDFIHLIDQIHHAGMKVMIDIVYNHTSPDSFLKQRHPDWFYQKVDGSFGNHIGEWTDIIDLDYDSSPDLWAYQIETLVEYAKVVDGFRCDVASLIPLPFWQAARKAVKEVNPDLVWLAESVEPSFILETRKQGITGLSDSEVYQAFDMTYDYDIQGDFDAYLSGQQPLSAYLNSVNRQNWTYPSNFTKLRFLENHDQARIAAKIKPYHSLEQITAFNFFLRGAHLIYNGQEVQAKHLPNLFEKDPIDWFEFADWSNYLSELIRIKKEYIPSEGSFEIGGDDDLEAIWIKYQAIGRSLIGVFALNKEKSGHLSLPVPDGLYHHLSDGQTIRIEQGMVALSSHPLYFIDEI